MKKTVLASIILLLASPFTYAEEVLDITELEEIPDIAEEASDTAEASNIIEQKQSKKPYSMYGLKVAQLDYHGFTDLSNGLEIEKMNAYGLFYESVTANGLGFGVEALISQEVPMTSYGRKKANVSFAKLNSYLSFTQYLIKQLYVKTKIGYVVDRSLISGDKKVSSFKQTEDKGISFSGGLGIDIMPSIGIFSEYTYSPSIEGNSDISLGLYYRN